MYKFLVSIFIVLMISSAHAVEEFETNCLEILEQLSTRSPLMDLLEEKKQLIELTLEIPRGSGSPYSRLRIIHRDQIRSMLDRKIMKGFEYRIEFYCDGDAILAPASQAIFFASRYSIEDDALHFKMAPHETDESGKLVRPSYSLTPLILRLDSTGSSGEILLHSPSYSRSRVSKIKITTSF